MEFITLIVLATLGEAIWETLKMVWQEGKASIDKIGALVVALVITLGTGIDIMPMLGLKTQWGILGAILTAILISRGATFTHELISKVSNIKGETFKEDVKNITDKI
ncbi:hypothetical protein KPL36_19060 [Clostridium gasigenes]|nr:hypothetical protein [Clostridium gasigenes]